MVKTIYLCSLRERVGKSFLSIGILQKLKTENKKAIYFKPIGIPASAYSDKADRDVGFIQKTCINQSKFPYDLHSPVSIPDCYYVDLVDQRKKEEYLELIKQAYNTISKDVDYVIIEGAPSIKKFIRVGLDDITIAQSFGLQDVIYVETESSDKCIDNLFFTKKYFDYRKIGIKGIIFNKIDHDYIARIRELEINHIKKYDIPIIGIVEKSLELFSPRVLEIIEAIGGELINEITSESLDDLVETYIIGAMNTQSAMKYLRQVKRAAFITGGDRSDLILAAINEDISCLILTGFIQPDIKVIIAANERGIPIILSPSDTYTTMRNLMRIRPSIQEKEINLTLEILEKSLNWNLLFA
ncbi:MAG: DRTGG domain-containing protein [Promethearchaeota archaeon]